MNTSNAEIYEAAYSAYVPAILAWSRYKARRAEYDAALKRHQDAIAKEEAEFQAKVVQYHETIRLIDCLSGRVDTSKLEPAEAAV